MGTLDLIIRTLTEATEKYKVKKLGIRSEEKTNAVFCQCADVRS